jgi:predicted component of viral defense system (DUF524 family)
MVEQDIENVQMMEQKIIINLIDSNAESFGNMTIICEEKVKNPQNFTYKNIEFKNIPKVEEPDDKTPIQYLINEEIRIPKIMLLEETEYQIKIESTSENNLKIVNNLKSLIKPIKYNLNSQKYRVCLGILNFSSFVGKSFIELINNGSLIIEVPIEVRSKKMNYFKHYPKMLADLGDFFLSLILESNSPVFQEFVHGKECSNTLYEDFMYLEYIFHEENLINDLEFINRHIHKTIERKIEFINSNFTKKILPNNLSSITNNPQYLEKVPTDNFKYLNGFYPEKIQQHMNFETVDNNENRFLKYFLENLDILVNNMLKDISNSYIEDQLNYFKDTIQYYLSQNWLREVKTLRFVAFNSQVLQKKEGYRNILRYFINLNLSFKLEWNEVTSKIKGNEKKLSELYEYWCYIKLLKVLNEIIGESIDVSQIFNINEKRWSINLKKNLSKTFKFKNIKIRLFYNKTFSNHDNINNKFKSYSLNLKPDYSLLLENNDKYFFIHFDAKYKAKNEVTVNFPDLKNLTEYYDEITTETNENLENQNDFAEKQNEHSKNFKNEDIYKMHTYKDAILSSEGAYILYPGDKFEIFEVKKGQKIPSVGAFSLNPGYTAEEDNLKNFILEILNNLK